MKQPHIYKIDYLFLKFLFIQNIIFRTMDYDCWKHYKTAALYIFPQIFIGLISKTAELVALKLIMLILVTLT